MLISIVVGAVVAVVCLVAAFYFLRQKRLIDDLPTSKTLGVFIGLAELKGTAESDNPFTSRLAEIPCVYYSWKVEEHWSRTVTTIGPKGRPQTRHESGWKTVANGEKLAPFYLEDDKGIIRVVPRGAKIQGKEVFDRTCNRFDSLYFGKGPRDEIANTDHRRRFYETALPLHTHLYVMGQAREREDVVAAEIAKDKNAPLFLISTRTEKHISRWKGVWYWVWTVLGLLAAVGGIFAGYAVEQNNPSVDLQFVAIAIGGYLLVALLGWLWTVYNSLIGLRQRVKQGWAQVDIQLKRRSDLIPNLVETVQGYAEHEGELQEFVTRLRQQMEATPPGAKGPDYDGFLPTLRVTVENYPDLKSSELFLGLQKQLAETEERIALARDYFNQITTFYNTRLEIVPDKFLAGMMKLKPQSLMYAADFERAPVKVDLAS